MHFGITEKPTTDCVSLYNNAGLISKVSENIASENAENCHSRVRQPHYRLTRAPRFDSVLACDGRTDGQTDGQTDNCA